MRWRFVLLNLVVAALAPLNVLRMEEASPGGVAVHLLAAGLLGVWAVALYRTAGRFPALDLGAPVLLAVMGIAGGGEDWAFGPMYITLFLHALYGSRTRVLRNAVSYLVAHEATVGVLGGLDALGGSQLFSRALGLLIMAWVLSELGVFLRRTDAGQAREQVLTDVGRRLLRARDPQQVAEVVAEGVEDLATVGGIGKVPPRVAVWWQERDELLLAASAGPSIGIDAFDLSVLPSEAAAHYLRGGPLRLGPEEMRAAGQAAGAFDVLDHGLAVPLSDGVTPRGMVFVQTSRRLDDGALAAIDRFAHEASLAEQAVRRSRLLSGVVDNSPDGIALVDADGRFRFISPAVAELAARSVAVGEHVGALLATWSGERARPVAELSEIAPHSSLALRRAGGDLLEVEVSTRPVTGEGTVLNIRDVSEQRRLQAEITYRAFYDRVTGLPNRALFLDRLTHAMARTARDDRPVAVALLDLDTFKGINDRWGHLAGDELLHHVGEQIAARVREGDTVARLGGDEFALLFEDLDPGGLEGRGLLDDILESVRTPLDIDGHQISVTASGGLAISTGRETAEQMLGAADLAMYEAKAHGKNTAVTFHPGMRVELDERRALRDELETAIADGQLRVHYQPILSLGEEATTGVEALVRWQHPTRGLVDPEVFIALAEESGLILPLGRWVLHAACRHLAGWKAAGLVGDGFQLHVNLSVRQLTGDQLLSDVEAALAATGLTPADLALEVTETALAENPELAETTLRQLHGLGVAVAIDDFGTGYASFTYLRRFPVDIVKIDRTFVADITHGPEEAALARAIVRLANSLGMGTVAEGVETEAHRELLTEWGCSLAQGWLWAPALPAVELEHWLVNRVPGLHRGGGRGR